MKTKIDYKKAKWMKAYEETLVSLCPEYAGKIDWDTATYLYNQGFDAVSSAHNKANKVKEQA